MTALLARSKSLVLLTSIASLILLSSGCQSAKQQRQIPDPIYIFYIPEKVATPQKPAMEKVSTTKAMDNPREFKKLQRNITRLVTYSNNLKSTVDHYEKIVDEMQKMYDDLKTENPQRDVRQTTFSPQEDPAKKDE